VAAVADPQQQLSWEARRRKPAGIAALIAAVRPGVRAEQVCTDVMTAIDVENPVDDVALLVVRRDAVPRSA
jgi:hypothetical protein